MTTKREAVVVGGGLAGITTSLILAERGWGVTLVEARPRLGGRATSYKRGDLTVDNGQHVFLRCCTAYRGLLERLGAGPDTGMTHLQDRLDIPLRSAADGTEARLRRNGLPAPLHLARALGGYGLLPLRDRAKLGGPALALRRTDPSSTEVDERGFGQFLREHGQSQAAIDRLWSVISTATLNIAPDDASLALAAKVFRTGLLETNDGADLGYATVPLGRIHDELARKALGNAGVTVLDSTKAEPLAPDAQSDNPTSDHMTAWVGQEPEFPQRPNTPQTTAGPEPARTEQQLSTPQVAAGSSEPLPPDALSDNPTSENMTIQAGQGPDTLPATAGRSAPLAPHPHAQSDNPTITVTDRAGNSTVLTADAIILAVPHDTAADLLPRSYRPTGFDGLGHSPILNIHLRYDRPVLDGPFLAAVDSPAQWIFDRTAASGLDGPPGSYLAITVSAADDLIDTPTRELAALFEAEVARLLPDAAGARLEECFVTRERHATFRQERGSAALRPGPATGMPGVYLAGAWTDTGWPDTMESAVRSGIAAARLVVDQTTGEG